MRDNVIAISQSACRSRTRDRKVLHAILKLLWFICALIAFNVRSASADANVDEYFAEGEAVARYDGPITPRGLSALLQVLDRTGAKVLRIRSVGGDVWTGIQMGNAVFERRLSVQVFDYCLSSCANYVFTSAYRKTIEKNTIVAWHGGSLQKSSRERLEQLIQMSNDQGDEALDPADRARLYGSYRNVMAQANLFTKSNVKEYLTRAGQEPIDYGGFWTLDLEDMAFLGVNNVDAEHGYGANSFCESWNSLRLIKARVKCLKLDDQQRKMSAEDVAPWLSKFGASAR
jgi:hypothetical protein